MTPFYPFPEDKAEKHSRSAVALEPSRGWGYALFMRRELRLLTIALALLGVVGCETFDLKGGAGVQAPGEGYAWPFAPVSMRISPFTAIRPIEEGEGGAELDLKVELLDQVGDMTKGVGALRFELYRAEGAAQLQQRTPMYTWEASLSSIEANRAHYNATLRTYDFRLTLERMPSSETPLRIYVQLTPPGGRRLTADAAVAPER